MPYKMNIDILMMMSLMDSLMFIVMMVYVHLLHSLSG
jgi:hypothetical protein